VVACWRERGGHVMGERRAADTSLASGRPLCSGTAAARGGAAGGTTTLATLLRAPYALLRYRNRMQRGATVRGEGKAA